MFLRVLTAEAKLREKQISEKQAKLIAEGKVEGKGKAEFISIPATHQCPGFKEGNTISLVKPNLSSMPARQAYNLAQVWKFITTMHWKSTTAGANGSSWVEMFARFCAIGGFAPNTEPRAGHLAIRETFKTQLLSFRRLFRQIITMYAKPGDKLLFLPARSGYKRLGYSWH